MQISDILLIAAMALSSCSNYISYSMIGPFFPVVALQRQISETISGLIFAIYGIILLVVSPLTGRYVIPHFGVKRTAIIGMIVCAFGHFAFSFLEMIHSKNIFTAMSFTLRATIAFGASNYMTSEFTMIMAIFPGKVGQIIVRQRYLIIKMLCL